MSKNLIIVLCFYRVILKEYAGLSSPIAPFVTYKHSAELKKDIANLWWAVDDADREITFELHMKSTG